MGLWNRVPTASTAATLCLGEEFLGLAFQAGLPEKTEDTQVN
jgi:hypothetical protein